MAFLCRHCGVSGTHESVVAAGSHHNIGCTRYKDPVFKCRYCGSLGESASIVMSGPHHSPTCPRFADSLHSQQNSFPGIWSNNQLGVFAAECTVLQTIEHTSGDNSISSRRKELDVWEEEASLTMQELGDCVRETWGGYFSLLFPIER